MKVDLTHASMHRLESALEALVGCGSVCGSVCGQEGLWMETARHAERLLQSRIARTAVVPFLLQGTTYYMNNSFLLQGTTHSMNNSFLLQGTTHCMNNIFVIYILIYQEHTHVSYIFIYICIHLAFNCFSCSM